MKTCILSSNQCEEAAQYIKKGGLVVFPTETVYGLGANAFNPQACTRIFTAKGRPSDNPLIVHVSSWEQVRQVVSEIPEDAKKLADKFWPGPLSLILPKSKELPEIVTAGLLTVAVRWPSAEITQKFLKDCGVPVAAPSANVSGAPSPTNFEMAKAAMLGRVEAILQGEDSEVGLESTIVGFINGKAKIFRPGGISAEQVAETLNISLNDLVYAASKESRPLAPGMKYTHYKPLAEVILFESLKDLEAIKIDSGKIGIMGLDEDLKDFKLLDAEIRTFQDWNSYAHSLYAQFYDFDQLACSVIYAQLPPQKGIGRALVNRLSKAAGVYVN